MPTTAQTTIPFGRPMIGDEERAAVADVLAGPVLTHGPRVKEFEQAFADYTGAPHAIATASCMAALHLAWLAIDLGPGDEVVVPAQTHVATAHAVEICGAKPIFLDSEERTGNVDLEQLEGLLNERTRGISLVHYLGLPVDMGRLMEIARRHGLFVLEDAAIALGARLDGTHTGLHGDAGTFSFYPVKHIATGEGGMLITNRDDVAQRVSKQRGFGIDKNVITDRRHTGAYDVEYVGLNYRMGEVAAAMGTVQLGRLPQFLEARRENYEGLYAGLSEIDELQLLDSRGDERFGASHYCLVALLCAPLGERREEIIEALKGRGVGTSVYYPKSLPDTVYYGEKYGYRPGHCPVATRISTTSIAFPVAPHLAGGDVDRIVATVKETIQEISCQ